MEQTTAAATLAAYRTTHRIAPMIRDGQDICSVDGIRVLPVRGGRLRHHPDDIERLACPECQRGVGITGGPSHFASPRCESGRETHCSCDTCF